MERYEGVLDEDVATDLGDNEVWDDISALLYLDWWVVDLGDEDSVEPKLNDVPCSFLLLGDGNVLWVILNNGLSLLLLIAGLLLFVGGGGGGGTDVYDIDELGDDNEDALDFVLDLVGCFQAYLDADGGCGKGFVGSLLFLGDLPCEVLLFGEYLE